MTNCPPRLRGDLSKWLCEINTGVYVGNVSSRVRDAVWDRVCQNLKNGQATLVYTAAGEQRMEFRTHNTSWEAVDFDGRQVLRGLLRHLKCDWDGHLRLVQVGNVVHERALMPDVHESQPRRTPQRHNDRMGQPVQAGMRRPFARRCRASRWYRSASMRCVSKVVS